MDEYKQGNMAPAEVLARYRQPYVQYAIQAQESGDEPMPFNDWARQQYQNENALAPAIRKPGFLNTLASLVSR